jgi:hypothetical protein
MKKLFQKSFWLGLDVIWKGVYEVELNTHRRQAKLNKYEL